MAKQTTAEVTFVTFSNGVVVCNTTPHPANLQDIDGELVSVPVSGILVNAKAVETQVSDLFVKTSFVGNEEGLAGIAKIQQAFSESGLQGTLVIIGSIIAAQAYPGQVVSMVPVPGFERVAPAEKRMRCDRFTTFAD